MFSPKNLKFGKIWVFRRISPELLIINDENLWVKKTTILFVFMTFSEFSVHFSTFSRRDETRMNFAKSRKKSLKSKKSFIKFRNSTNLFLPIVTMFNSA
jgi:ATP-dependent Zn protease